MASKTIRQPNVILPPVTAALRRAYELECQIENVLEAWDAIGTSWPVIEDRAVSQVLTTIVMAWEVPDDHDH